MKNSKDPNEPRTATEAQIDANRENAKKSTGPRTAEGKAASSRNRLLHGLRANKHILLDEDPEDFLMLLKDLHDRFQPFGDGEEMLVLRIANDQWRLRRALPMEAGIFRNRLREVADEEADNQRQYVQNKEFAESRGVPLPTPPGRHDDADRLPRAFDADCVAPNSFAKLARYESSIQNSIDRSLRQLKTYQAARTASTTRPDEPPEVGQAVPPAEAAPPVETPAEPAATPSNSVNYHSNPKNEGVAQFGVPSGSVAMALMLYAMPLIALWGGPVACGGLAGRQSATEHSRSRRGVSRARLEGVAESPHRMNQPWIGRVGLDLLPQPKHINVHGAVGDGAILPPYGVQQLLTAEDHPRTAHQEFEQTELRRG